MSLWPFGKKKKKRAPEPAQAPKTKGKKRRTPAEVAREDLTRLEVKIKRAKLKRELKRIIENDDEPQQPDGYSLTQIRQMRKQLKEFGLDIVHTQDGQPLDDDESMSGVVKQLVRESAKGLIEVLMGKVGTQQVETTPTVEQPKRLPAPVVRANPTPVQQPAPTEEQPAGGTMDPSDYLIGQLKDKTPQQAALWFCNQQDERLRTFVDILRKTPDGLLPVLIQNIAGQQPSLAHFTAWLFERWDTWTLPTINAIREYVESRPATGTGV